MELIGITIEDFRSAVESVSLLYGGNVVIHDDAKETSSRSSRGRVVVRDSRGEGARRSWSGRRGRWACWHVYRDVLETLFADFPEAKVRTSLATYDGEDGFRASYPVTAYRNIGSVAAPAYMPELCDCGDDHRGSDE